MGGSQSVLQELVGVSTPTTTHPLLHAQQLLFKTVKLSLQAVKLLVYAQTLLEYALTLLSYTIKQLKESMGGSQSVLQELVGVSTPLLLHSSQAYCSVIQ